MGNVLGAHTVRLIRLAALVLAAGCVGTAPPPAPRAQADALPPPLPDTTGWGIHVLVLERAANGPTWAGTYGHGVFVLRARSREWERLAENDSTGISWGFVNSIAFERDSSVVWYGTVGNGFGRSTDGGRTWRNWTFTQLGPEWQYVAHDGIVARRDTIYIATADGLRITGDGGTTWRCIQESNRVRGGAAPRDDGCTQRIESLPTKYLLSLDVSNRGVIYAGHLRGLSVSRDGGRTWTDVQTEGIAGQRVRGVRTPLDSLRLMVQMEGEFPFDTAVWAITEAGIFVDSARANNFRAADVRVPGFPTLPGSPRTLTASRAGLPPIIATSYGLLARTNEGGYRMYYIGAADRYRPAGDIWTAAWWGPPYWPIGGSASGLNRVLAGDIPVAGIFDSLPPALPAAARHLWFQRPISGQDGNPHIDATYRYGSTMGGNFQQHQGVEFNNPAGTPVRAIGDGVVVFAGAAEQGSNTVAIRHDRQWEGQHVFSTYYHNSALTVSSGQRVRAGEVIARVGNTGRATNDHLHLEVHVAPQTDSARIVDPAVRFPPHTVNPQLWIEPMPGTGVVAGRVLDASGQPVPGARIYGLVLPYPVETPFSFAETYRDRARGTPAYDEHFAVGDVPPGTYTLGVLIGDRRVWRRVRVQPGMVTFVEFRQ